METKPIIVGETNFSIKITHPRYSDLVNNLKTRFITFKRDYNKKLKRVVFVRDKEYYGLDTVENHIKFPIGLYDHIKPMLDSRDIAQKKTAYKEIKIKYSGKITPRDYQEDAIQQICESIGVRHVGIGVGGGKTLIASMVALRLSRRTLVIVRKTDTDKWVNDLKFNLGDDCGRFMKIEGTPSLEKLLKMDEGNIPEFIIASISTLQLMILKYEKRKSTFGKITPNNMMEHLGIGLIINDETHLFFHAIYHMMCYFNVENFLALSATLDSSDQKKKEMIKAMFPPKYRVNTSYIAQKCLETTAISFKMRNLNDFRWSNVFGYNHVKYEQTILNRSNTLYEYLVFTASLVDDYFLDNYVSDDKCILFFSTVEMCTAVRDYLVTKYKDKRVYRYTQIDSYSEAMSSDIIITTVKSLGTGKDVPKLVTVMQMDSITDKNMNEQSSGRLRCLQGKRLRYVYAYCRDIPEQCTKHRDRMNVIKPKSKTFNVIHSDTVI
jgi:superfamily II DNA or RNA helicase